MSRVLLTSIGRRTYLARYFEAAFGHADLFVADADPAAPGMHLGYTSLALPSVTDARYIEELNHIIDRHAINLVVSLHDSEVAHLARLRALIRPEATVLGMPPENWDVGLDKLRTYRLLSDAGVAVPTSAISLAEANAYLAAGHLAFPLVVKPRYGSASIGIHVVSNREELEDSLLDTPTDGGGVLIQQELVGDEYGIDVVCDLDGTYLGVLARRKLRMSGGETDDAVTVEPALFDPVARKIAALTRHSGLIDVDAIETSEGAFSIIDVNPRFGGGYPFSHVAGADVPGLLHSLIEGRMPVESLAVRSGTRSRKAIDLVVVTP